MQHYAEELGMQGMGMKSEAAFAKRKALLQQVPSYSLVHGLILPDASVNPGVISSRQGLV